MVQFEFITEFDNTPSGTFQKVIHRKFDDDREFVHNTSSFIGRLSLQGYDYQAYCAAAVQIAREFTHSDLNSNDLIERYSRLNLLECILVSILPFNTALAYCCTAKNPYVTLSFQMAHGYDVDSNDPSFQNVCWQTICRIHGYMKQHQLIEWSDECLSAYLRYEEVSMPVLVREPGSKTARYLEKGALSN